MGPAIIGLIGALLGAAAAVVGSLVSARLQALHEKARWQRDRQQAAYDGALRYLLRAANRRSEFTVASGRISTVLSQEHVREWFDDLVEAQFWLRSLTSCCGAGQLERIRETVDALDGAVASLVNGGPRPSALTAVESLQTAIQTVAECARADGQALVARR